MHVRSSVCADAQPMLSVDACISSHCINALCNPCNICRNSTAVGDERQCARCANGVAGFVWTGTRGDGQILAPHVERINRYMWRYPMMMPLLPPFLRQSAPVQVTGMYVVPRWFALVHNITICRKYNRQVYNRRLYSSINAARDDDVE